ncbi:MAG TPA: DUF3006 domain-containing protein [Gemmatimonadales bacterium]
MRDLALLAVDRLEGTTAVLVDDAGKTTAVPLARLPRGLAEGDVLRVTIENDTPDWAFARIDREETDRRRAAGEALLDELRRRTVDEAEDGSGP